jgi:hypothetical protein
MKIETQQLIEYHGLRIRNSPGEKYDWCAKNFGNLGTRWFIKNNYIYFKNEADFSWYVLMWGDK